MADDFKSNKYKLTTSASDFWSVCLFAGIHGAMDECHHEGGRLSTQTTGSADESTARVSTMLILRLGLIQDLGNFHASGASNPYLGSQDAPMVFQDQHIDNGRNVAR